MRRAAGCAALGLLLLVAAATFAMDSLYVPGLALAGLGGGSALWVWVAWSGATFQRDPGPATVEENAPWPLRLRVGHGVLPAPGGEIVEPLLPQPIPLRSLAADSRGDRRMRVNVRFERRGRRRIEACRLVLADPLGLAQREVTCTSGLGEVLVLPRIEAVIPVEGGGAPGTEGRGREGGDGGGRARAPAPEMELDVLRPYRPGTPATRIHWPTLARTGELMERRLVADPRARPLVVVDSYTPVGEHELDSAMRAAASLVWDLARGGGCGVLLPGERRPTMLKPDLRNFPEIHAQLALLGPAGAPPSLGPRPGGPVVWVTASRSLPAIPASLGAGWVVAPHAIAPGAPAEFRVGGCIGQRLAAVWREAA